MRYWSVDGAGNIEGQHRLREHRLRRRPTTSATNLQADNHSGWQNSSQTVTLTPSDALSGTAATYYTIDGGAQQTYGAPFSVSGDGSHADRLLVGRRRRQRRGTQHRLREHRPHGAGHHGHRPAGQRHHRLAEPAQTVTLTPSDALSGVAATYYTIDGGAQQTYGAPFSVSGAGSHAIVYWSVDAAGNAESAQHRLREHRHDGAGHHGHRPAGEQPHRLAELEPAGHADAERRSARAWPPPTTRSTAAPSSTYGGGPFAVGGRAATRSSTGRSTPPATPRRRTTPATSTST